jgi:hypothetical protein
MKIFILTLLFLSVAFIAAPVSKAQISRYDLLGRWEMYKIFRGDKEVTNVYLPEAWRWISFEADNTFVSDGETFDRKAGKYSLDEATGLLSFNLDLGFGQFSYWQVNFDGRQMIWTDRGNPLHEQIKIILVPDF